MSYLSNTSTPLKSRLAASDAALAYVEALAHEESMFKLMQNTEVSDPYFDGIEQSWSDASSAVESARYLVEVLSRELAKTPPL